jgi:hypothetical protein
MADQADPEVVESVPVAFLFADRVLTEEGNKKKTIVGAFSRFYAQNFPAVFAPWFVYIAFTNVLGKHPFSMYLVREKEQQFIYTLNGEFATESKSAVIEMVFVVANAVFPAAGDYVFTFTIDGKPAMTRILEVRPTGAPT